jgi:ubiquinone/menaquinone biosynthesis C-methylase UbiE
MSSAEPFPLFHPADARRAFESDEVVRRFAHVANLANGSRVLELACGRGAASVVLARELGCEVVAADTDEKVLAQLSERIKSHALTDRISVRRVELNRLPFGDGEFDFILVQGRVVLPLTVAARVLRRHLAPRGRVCLTYPAKVGRFPSKAALDSWERRLGEGLLFPRELLQVLERNGYEPEGVETLSEAELAEYYRGVEQKLAGQSKEQEAAALALQEEIDLFRAHAGKSGVTYAMVIGRRKEPGEKPPLSRDRG